MGASCSVVGSLQMKAVHIEQRIEMGRLCKRVKRTLKATLSVAPTSLPYRELLINMPLKNPKA
jgi:hypothetical protein